MIRRARAVLLLAVAVAVVGTADLGRSATDQANVDIVAINLSGGQTNPTRNPALDLNPAAARDGRIVFLSTRGGDSNLYVLDGGGRNVRRLTNSPADHSGIAGADDLEFSRAAWLPRAIGSRSTVSTSQRRPRPASSTA